MGVRIIHDEKNEIACLYCSTTGWAFGQVAEGYDADLQLEEFMEFLNGVDPRELSEKQLVDKWCEFSKKREDAGVES